MVSRPWQRSKAAPRSPVTAIEIGQDRPNAAMSIVESLKRLIDPAQAKKEEAERKRARERPMRDDAAAPPRFRCRVCGQPGRDPMFCADCLAATMEPLRK
jgi:hypothetical protein